MIRVASSIVRSSLLASSVSLSSIGAVWASDAVAQVRDVVVTVPAQDLASALRNVSAQTGVTVSVDPDAVAGRRSRPVKNARSARNAVLAAIAGTQLAVRVADDGGLEVFQAGAAQSGDIVVVAQRDEAETNYNVNRATTSNRAGGDLRSLPQNTAVISDKLIRDQQAQTITEAVRNVAGVAIGVNGGQGLAGFSVRGFGVAPLTNGTGQTASAANAGGGIQPVSNVERIEVLKGPAAILAGQRNLGGTINVVTKKPTADPLLIVTAEYQSRDSFKGIVDASNALVDSKVLSARIIAEAQHADRSYGGYDGREEYLLAPTLRYKDGGSDFIIGMSTTSQRQPAVYATVINTVAGGPVPVGKPLDRPLAVIGRANAGVHVDNTRFSADLTQKVAPWMTLSARGEHYKQTINIQPINGLSQVGYGRLLAFNSHARDYGKGNSADAYARFNFSTLGIKHTLVTGYNYTDLQIRHFDAASGAPVTINLLDPAARVPAPQRLSSTVSYTIDYNEHGVYASNLIEYGPVHLSAAIRKNWYDALTLITFRNRRTQENADSVVPALGLVVDVTPTISLYGNYTKGFVPTTALAFDGTKLPDVKSTNKEVGVKADLFRKNASLVVSLFQTEQDNRIIPDPARPGFSTTIPGGQRGRGVDATLTGRILTGLNVNATYAYTDYDFANPAAAAASGLLSVDAQPAHTYSLFTAYEATSAAVGGALGVFGRSSSTVTGNRVVYTVPGGAQFDGNIYFNMGAARLNLSLKNIFDKRLYMPATTVNYVPIADGRTLTATLSYRFF